MYTLTFCSVILITHVYVHKHFWQMVGPSRAGKSKFKNKDKKDHFTSQYFRDRHCNYQLKYVCRHKSNYASRPYDV